MIGIGKLVEYLDNGKFVCGLVTESQPKRLRLINQNGRELNLPVSRVIHYSQSNYATNSSREELVDILQNASRSRHDLMEKINLEELWELTNEEPTSLFSPQFLAELSFGQDADDHLICALLRSVFLDKLFFKYKEGKIRINSAEQVEQLRLQLAAEEKRAHLVEEGSRMLSAINNGASPDDFSEQSDLLDEVLEMVKDYYLFGNDSKHYKTARQLLKNSSLNEPHAPYHLMIKAGIWSEHENIPLLRNEIPVGFSLAARQQAEHILRTDQGTLFKDQERIDYTHLKPVTIDGAATQDFDDALTIEKDGDNFLVGIHISDVAHYVRPGDSLFQEAMQRGTSIYFPEGQIPMLPRHLSQGICSLIQGEIRAAFSFMILLSPDAEILRVHIKPSIIKVARRLTYEEADSMLETDEELKLLNKLSTKLRQKRINNGALLLPFPDVNIFIDNNNKVHVNLAKSDTPARILVSEMMILANSEAARYVADRMVPGLYRSQPELKNRIVHGSDTDLFQNTRQRKHLPRGELSTNAKSHSGLGVNQYSTVTSPIRRLLDLVMQHQLNSIVRRLEPCFTDDMCKDFAALLNRTLSRANNVRQQRHRYWLLKYLEDRIGQYMEALVIEAGPKRTNLLLTDILMDVDLASTSHTSVKPGDKVKIRVVKADALDNVVRFDW